jgi:hypothetical protein
MLSTNKHTLWTVAGERECIGVLREQMALHGSVLSARPAGNGQWMQATSTRSRARVTRPAAFAGMLLTATVH